jgi:riboflavin biosynthesis pyrimidine reductase
VSEPDVRLEALFDPAPSNTLPLPSRIEEAYGGALGLPRSVVYANFVTSIDGVASIAGERASSAIISGGSKADRFVVALLRSVADAVVIGSGTLREHEGPWTAERAFAEEAASFGELRRTLSLAPEPALVVVTGSGSVPQDHPAIPSATVITSEDAGAKLASVRCREIVPVGSGDRVDLAVAVEELRSRGYRRILTEGGPRLMGSMLKAQLVDELFVSVSPKLIGGASNHSLAGGADVSHTGGHGGLLSVRRSDDYLFLRYAIGRPGDEAVEPAPAS